MTNVLSEARLQHSLAAITRLLERHRVLDTLAHRQEGRRRDLLENLQHRQNLAELHKHLRTMHAADIAYVLEALPIEDRQTVWEQVEPEIAGRVFVEVSSTVRESLIDATPRDALVRMLSTLDLGDLGYVSELLPEEVLNEVSRALESSDRAVFEASIQYGEETVGHYMTREFVAVPDTYTVQQTLEDLRRR